MKVFRMPTSLASEVAWVCRHLSLAGAHTCETEVKKSRFLATGWPVTSASQVLATFTSAGQSPALLSANTSSLLISAGITARSRSSGPCCQPQLLCIQAWRRVQIL